MCCCSCDFLGGKYCTRSKGEQRFIAHRQLFLPHCSRMSTVFECTWRLRMCNCSKLALHHTFLSAVAGLRSAFGAPFRVLRFKRFRHPSKLSACYASTLCHHFSRSLRSIMSSYPQPALFPDYSNAMQCACFLSILSHQLVTASQSTQRCTVS